MFKNIKFDLMLFQEAANNIRYWLIRFYFIVFS